MTRRSRSSAARLHHAVREIVFASNPEEGLLEALKLANDPPEEWEPSMWLTVAEGVESAAHREANWWRVAILAYEQLASDAISRDALTAMEKRVNLIEKVGPRAHDRFADPEVVSRGHCCSIEVGPCSWAGRSRGAITGPARRRRARCHPHC